MKTLKPVWNRTKIVATIGPSSAKYETLCQMIESGLDVCRINASHGSHELHQKSIDLIRQINKDHGLFIPILLDLQGPKLRVGRLDPAYPIRPGNEIIFSTAVKEREGNRIPIEYPSFAKDVKSGDRVLVEDGKIELRVVETDGQTEVRLTVINGELIADRKGLNLPDTRVSLPAISEKDLQDVAFAAKNHVEWIALSFVQSPEDVHRLRKILKDSGSDARIVAKIEKPAALEYIDAIIKASDAIMVARGDLGVEIPIEEVPFWQKQIVAKCNAAARPVIVATQMLDSMIKDPRPTRAEATDCANAVLDGADALMLSGETSVGAYPVAVVQTMQRIIKQAEHNPAVFERHYRLDHASPTFHSDAVCLTACQLASQISAKAIIGMTVSGYNAYQIAKHRPQAPVFIFTDNEKLINALNLVWGVRAFYYSSFEGTNETIQDVISILKSQELVRPGEWVVNTASMPLQSRQRTNMIKITLVE